MKSRYPLWSMCAALCLLVPLALASCAPTQPQSQAQTQTNPLPPQESQARPTAKPSTPANGNAANCFRLSSCREMFAFSHTATAELCWEQGGHSWYDAQARQCLNNQNPE